MPHRPRLVALLAALLAVVGTSEARAWQGPTCAFDAAMTAAPPPVDAPVQSGPVFMCVDLPDPAPRLAPVAGPSELNEATAQRALHRARSLQQDGRYGEALLNLDLVAEAFPRVSDRIALERGMVLLAASRPADARKAFAQAEESIDSTVRAKARVGSVRALIAEGKRHAARELTELLKAFPQLPDRLELRFQLAQHYERKRDVNNAVRIFRDIDLEYPGSIWAERSRDRMDAMRRAGKRLRTLTVSQEVERANRLARQAPVGIAKEEIKRLFANKRLNPAQRGDLARVAAWLARREGRWDEAQKYLSLANGSPAEDTEARERAESLRQEMSDAANARKAAVARSQIKRLKGRKPYSRMRHGSLLRVVEIAARAGLKPELNEALTALRRGRRVSASIRFDAAVVASGLADDANVAAVFAGLVGDRRHGLAARYHYARTLERMGRFEDAESQYLRVKTQERSSTRWYSLLANQRLWSVREALAFRCGPDAPGADVPDAGTQPVLLAALGAPPFPSRQPRTRREGMIESNAENPRENPPEPSVDFEGLAARLAPVAQAQQEHYPWLSRAYDLLKLADADAAADELHEAYVAWRDARGRPLRGAGIEAVYRGKERVRKGVSFATRSKRRKLSTVEKETLADVASALGDEGVAVGFGGRSRVNARPRAYESLAKRAARRHGLDPNLLLAVMRVESVYQRRIVSYAGAVGLMQIMPRTGRLIASQLGRRDFTTTDLLDPATNLEFAAWYLASLIERFDGRLPLAIASYNGGPHNVRRWMRDHGDALPLDAFAERIPFTQTHRYVRRVLTHYAAYRAQEGLPMEHLALALPVVEPDPVAF